MVSLTLNYSSSPRRLQDRYVSFGVGSYAFHLGKILNIFRSGPNDAEIIQGLVDPDEYLEGLGWCQSQLGGGVEPHL